MDNIGKLTSHIHQTMKCLGIRSNKIDVSKKLDKYRAIFSPTKKEKTPESSNIPQMQQLTELEVANERKISSCTSAINQQFLSSYISQDGNVKVLDTAQRVETVNLRKKQIENTQIYLQQQLVPLVASLKEEIRRGSPLLLAETLNKTQNLSKSSLILEKIEKCQKEMTQVQELVRLNETYASTNSSRNIFVRKGAEAKKEYVPLLANLLNQKVFVGAKEKSSINRSAAISDFTHGETSLIDIQNYQLLQRFANNEQPYLTDSQQQQLKHLCDVDIIDTKKLAEVMDNLRQKIQIAYGTEFDFPNYQLLQRLANNEQLSESQKLQLKHLYAIDANAPDPKKLATVMEKLLDNSIKSAEIQRVRRLESLFLQDLETHLKYGAKLLNDNVLCMGRVALVDTNKEANDPAEDGSVFVLNERNQALDMMAIYQRFEGKTIRFDLDEDAGAFIDPFDEAIIHAPKTLVAPGQEPVVLTTAFVNISVCCNTKNEGAQAFINELGLKKLESLVALLPDKRQKEAATSLLLQLQEEIQPKKDCNFQTADKCIQLMALLGCVSADCYGGKDRTGYLLATVTSRIAKAALRLYAENNPGYNADKDLAKIDQWLMSDEAIAKKIIKMNTGHTAIKLMATIKNLPMFSSVGLIKAALNAALVMTGIASVKDQDPQAAYSHARRHNSRRPNKS